MLLFIAGIVIGAFLGVMCIALLTAASDADRNAGEMFNGRHRTTEN